jgi:regulator of cell morphogenesis and NO signaling
MQIQSLLKDIALSHPAAASVLENLRLDYCCGGKQSLADACRAAGLDADSVVTQLRDAQAQPAPAYDPATATPAALIRHLVDTHHAFTRNELARLETLLDKVTKRHGEAHPELNGIGETFKALRDDLIPHLLKEETILFPYIEALALRNAGEPRPPACFGDIDNPLRQMNEEHEAVGGLLKRLRQLTSDYLPPADACASYQAAWQGLQALDADLIQHIHLENNVLFPAARTLAEAA